MRRIRRSGKSAIGRLEGRGVVAAAVVAIAMVLEEGSSHVVRLQAHSHKAKAGLRHRA